jgi:hypothetical protein
MISSRCDCGLGWLITSLEFQAGLLLTGEYYRQSLFVKPRPDLLGRKERIIHFNNQCIKIVIVKLNNDRLCRIANIAKGTPPFW